MKIDSRAFSLFCILVISLSLNARDFKVLSPSGRLRAVVSVGEQDSDKALRLSIVLDDEVLMQPSVIGMDIEGVSSSVRVKSQKQTVVVDDTDSPLYRQKHITMKANEMDMLFTSGLGLRVRAYDEGIAYKFYTLNGKKGERIVNTEKADYDFGSSKAWISYTTNDKKPMAMAFQNIYTEERLDSALQQVAFLPATIDCGRAKVTLLESDVESYPCMFIIPQNGVLKATFAPYPKTMERYQWRSMTYVGENEDFIAKVKSSRSYPWRIFVVTENDTDMPTNNLVYSLATKNKIGDISWIKPGKVAWDWWNDWNLKGVDFEAGINFETYRYYIDFAASHGLEYIILDEGWYNSAKGDIMNAIPEIKLPELIEYGKQKGVGIVLWAVFNVLDEHLDEACRKYSDMGVKGFKVDFMDRSDQTAVEMVERIAQKSAEYRLILDFHGIYTPVGLNRTYPNVLNYESVFGMEEVRWTTIEDHDMPLYDVTFPFIRMMAGQVDFTPGAMRNAQAQDWKAVYRKPMSMGTRCHQAACYIVHDSPFTMLADSPTNYEAEESYTNFIASLPVTFDETRVFQGEMGKYIVTARRKGNTWYIAGQTNWESRDITLDLSSLGIKQGTRMQLLRDGINADHDAEDYKIIGTTYKNNMAIHLAKAGGFVMVIDN